MLVMGMSSKKHKTPAIRFKGFTDAWEQRKLGELCEEFQSGKNIKAEDIKENGPFPVFGGNGIRGYSDTYNHDGVYALIGRQGALCGNTNISYGKAYFTEHAIAVKANISNDTKFMYYLLGNMNLGQYSSQSAQPGLAVNKLTRLSAFVPNSYEQKQISDFLISLDSTIALHQRQLDNYKQLKNSMMQKNFNQELRFKDENGNDYPAWQEYALSDIVYRVTRKNVGLISKLPLTISAQYGLVDQLTFFNKKVAGVNLEGYYLLENGEFAYNKSYSTGYPLGAIKRLDKYDKGLLSTLYICFSPRDVVDSDFLTQYFESTKWHKQIVDISGEGARNHGLLNIAVGDFFNTQHYLPCIEEQKKIANFHSALDQKVEIATRKVEILKEQKKGLMQRMFV